MCGNLGSGVFRHPYAYQVGRSLVLAEFATLRLRLLKIAGRITETATRVRIGFAAACSEAELFRGIARNLKLAGP